MCVNDWESDYPFSVNSNESEYPKNNESGNIYESEKISFSINLICDWGETESITYSSKILQAFPSSSGLETVSLSTSFPIIPFSD